MKSVSTLKIEQPKPDPFLKGIESEARPGKTFGEVLSRCKSGRCINEITGGLIQEELQKFKDQIVEGQTLSSRELLYYQIRANELNLRIELMSKCADGFLSLARKLQQGQ